MDGERFDSLTKLLATGATRRRIVRGLAGGATAVVAAVLGRGAQAAPNSCAVCCAGLPGPQKAACKQACRQCGGDCNRVCVGFGPFGPTSFTCCPEGTACDFGTGTCVELTICPTGEPAENCALGIFTDCDPTGACGLVDDVDDGCTCIERNCGAPCESSADCGGAPCVEVPGCCETLRFCATPCGEGGEEGAGTQATGWR